MTIKRKVVNGAISFLKLIPGLSRIVYKFSCLYIDSYRGYSYDPAQNGEYNIVLKALKAFNDELIFFDVGANIGAWSKYVVSHTDRYTGHLFELSKETFVTLNHNFQSYNNDKIILNNIGLSNRICEVEFRDYGKDNGGNTLLVNADYHKRPSVLSKANVTTGDAYMQSVGIERINFLKIDTEGHEFSVLQGFAKAFAEKRIDIVQFEYGYTHGDAKTLMQDFFRFFEERGYAIGRLGPTGLTFKTFEYTDNDFKSGPNYIACLPHYKKSLKAN